MLTKGFLRDLNRPVISGRRFFWSAILGSLSALGIYTFLCLFRLLYRVIDFERANGPILFDDAIRYWQNFNFAIVALVLGNALFLGALFRKPQSSVLPNYKRLTILNDQTFLGFNFFYVFIKGFILPGVLIAVNFDIELLSVSTYIFVLIGIAFFLESWKTLVRVFRRRAFIAMGLNFVVLVMLAFILAFTSIFDYRKMDGLLVKTRKK